MATCSIPPPAWSSRSAAKTQKFRIFSAGPRAPVDSAWGGSRVAQVDDSAGFGDFAHKRAEARIGWMLRDKWRLERLLGVGGMAAVYAAVHRNGKRGAVKMLHA